MDRIKKNEKPAFTIEERGFQAIAWYLEDTEESQGDALIKILRDGKLLREFSYPAYKIWNIAAHFSEIVDGELEKSNAGYRMAAWTGIGPV